MLSNDEYFDEFRRVADIVTDLDVADDVAIAAVERFEELDAPPGKKAESVAALERSFECRNPRHMASKR